VKGWVIRVGVLVVGIAACSLLLRRRPAAISGRRDAVVLPGVIERDAMRVDLYLPMPGAVAPWVVWVGDRFGAASAETLQRRGVAVALVASLPPAERASDVVRELRRRAPLYGLDARPILAGDGEGAAIAAALGTDPQWDLSSALAGVVVMNGAYDGIPRNRTPRAPFLILSGHGDRAQGARAWARELEHAGASVRHYHVGRIDESRTADLSGEHNDVADLLASFVRGEPFPGGPESEWIVADTWGPRAPLSSEGFWKDADRIVHHDADDPFRAALGRVFAGAVSSLDPWPRKIYEAIDLAAYWAAHPELGAGDWMVTTNARGEQLVFSREEIERSKPRIVVGIDDERNLFRLLVTYNVYRTYSFKPETGPRPLLARPLGAFLLFPDGRPRSTTLAEFALTPASFRVVDRDPLAAVRTFPRALARALNGEQGCLICHALHGAGARAHHLRAVDGAATGGEALPLEAYPRDVLRRFLFEPDEIASEFGVDPLVVTAEQADELLAAAAP
jgi:hypothetical protein